MTDLFDTAWCAGCEALTAHYHLADGLECSNCGHFTPKGGNA